ncbi:hypothetical protein [Marinicella litoralis]|uniref:Uncharacterized protein n=1 Tax=Marinicella litoralis TaxID=644220 RepID=A0A4R6XUB5_9GAMM|nr:hypothetical protein [Marinicella litoralis]TDR23582.1 hypothetical protein C8D91_0445 [Marinicella litoralis]
MTVIQNITPIMDCKKPYTVTLCKDQWLGECLDDYLFKLCGTDQVVWIPKDLLHDSSFNEHAFEAYISSDDIYCCARITISNSIRMCLVDQHQITGSQLMPYLNQSAN